MALCLRLQFRYLIVIFRRDKEFCHDCRYCCTLSICTTKHGSSFKFSNESLINGKEDSSNSDTVNAAMGFLTDMRMYKSYDFRCLKPNPNLPTEKWGHYEMHGYRAAASKTELGNQTSIVLIKF